MTIKTNLKAEGWNANHTETLVRDRQTARLKARTKLRAGMVHWKLNTWRPTT